MTAHVLKVHLSNYKGYAKVYQQRMQEENERWFMLMAGDVQEHRPRKVRLQQLGGHWGDVNDQATGKQLRDKIFSIPTQDFHSNNKKQNLLTC